MLCDRITAHSLLKARRLSPLVSRWPCGSHDRVLCFPIGCFLEVFNPFQRLGSPVVGPVRSPIPPHPAQSRIIAPDIRICRATSELASRLTREALSCGKLLGWSEVPTRSNLLTHQRAQTVPKEWS